MTMYFRTEEMAHSFLALCSERAIRAHVTRTGRKLIVEADVPRGAARSKFISAWSARSMEVPGRPRPDDPQLSLRFAPRA